MLVSQQVSMLSIHPCDISSLLFCNDVIKPDKVLTGNAIFND